MVIHDSRRTQKTQVYTIILWFSTSSLPVKVIGIAVFYTMVLCYTLDSFVKFIACTVCYKTINLRSLANVMISAFDNRTESNLLY